MNLQIWHFVCVSLIFACSGSLAENQEADPGFIHLQKADIQFKPVPDLPGLSFAVLAGNPGTPGTYVIRARFGPGVTTPPHYHDQDRHVTVLSGVWGFGTGDSGDCAETIPLKAGAFAMHPKGAVHYDGSCNGEVVIVEITGIGPVNTHWIESDE